MNIPRMNLSRTLNKKIPSHTGRGYFSPLSAGEIVITPNHCYAGVNKIDLAKDTVYKHPTEKQCSWEPSGVVKLEPALSINRNITLSAQAGGRTFETIMEQAEFESALIKVGAYIAIFECVIDVNNLGTRSADLMLTFNNWVYDTFKYITAPVGLSTHSDNVIAFRNNGGYLFPTGASGQSNTALSAPLYLYGECSKAPLNITAAVKITIHRSMLL